MSTIQKLLRKVSLNRLSTIKWWLTSPLFFIFFIPFLHSKDFNSLKSLTALKSLTQDKHGYIWLAGQQGLTRFDGKELITFANHSKQWPLPFTWIQNIAPVNDEFLISTETSGVWLFNPINGASTALPINIDNQSVLAAEFYQNNYYVIADKVYRFNAKTQKTNVLDPSISFGSFIKANDNLYLYSKTQLRQVTQNGLQTIIDSKVEFVASLGQSLIVAKPGSLQVLKDNKVVASLVIDYEVQAITKSFNGNSFFTLDKTGKLYKYDQDLKTLKHNFSDISGIRVKNIFHDSSNVIWYSSTQGVGRSSQIAIKNKRFIFNTRINAIKLAPYKNKIILGSYGDGLHNYHENELVIKPEVATKLTDSNRRITDLLVAGNELFIATFDGLWSYNLDTHQLVKVKFPQNDQLLLDLSLHHNQLYIATDGNGFLIYDVSTKKIIKEIDHSYPFSSAEILDSKVVKENDVWLATAAGIDIFNKTTEKITTINLPGSSKVVSLVVKDGRVFAFTKGSGAFIMNFDGELLKRVGKGIEFQSAAVVNNDIWAPSRNGLFKINTKTDEISLIPNTESFAFTGKPIIIEDNVYIGHFGGVATIPINETSSFDADIVISKTTVSGQSHILNKVIDIDSSNDVVQLDLASLDYRPGIEKQFEYQINNGLWYPVTANQLTLTGLASGSYFINIRGTNSLGQLSNKQAHAEIHVAYPWYWTPKIRVLYVVFLIGFISLVLWLLYLRGRSISHIHALLANDIKTKGKAVLHVQKNLSNLHTLWHQCIDDNEKLIANRDKIGSLIEKSIEELNDNSYTKTPDGLYGKTLSVALPYLIDYAEKKYQVKVHYANDIDESTLSYELQSDIYTMLYHAITSAVLNGNGRVFNISLKEFKQKIWLTISDDGSSFIHYKSKINFDMAMYFIRQIANKYKASVNVFEEQQTGSQLVISVPLMMLS